MKDTRRWWTAAELGAFAREGMPGYPKGRTAMADYAKRKDWIHCEDVMGRPMARRRKGRGGGWEYSERLLSQAAQAWLAKKFGAEGMLDEVLASRAESKTSDRYDEIPEEHRRSAESRLLAIGRVEEYRRTGMSVRAAVETVSREVGRAPSNIHTWRQAVAGLPEPAWLGALAPRRIAGAIPAGLDAAEAEEARLKAWQRETMEARAAILAAIDDMARQGMARTAAIREIVEKAKAGDLPQDLQNKVSRANAKAGKGRALSRSQIYEWFKLRSNGGQLALAPAAPEQHEIPAWGWAFFKLYARPQKPSLASVVEALPDRLPEDIEPPSYDQARRFLNKLSVQQRHRGRVGPRAFKALQMHVVRDTSDLWPTAVYVADGHTFDAEVSHPLHGRPFRPEITTVIDVYTRRATGWSVALSESTWSVLDAARHAFETSGLCDIWYVDRGKGFNNAAFDDALTGFLARLEVTKKNSLPYNSQARGVVERLHQSLWIRAAKQLPTYMGVAMDDEARQKAFKITRKEIAIAGKSRLLLEWQDFVAFCKAQVAAYNARPHSSLPKIRDPETGAKRHMSPDEAWDAWLAENPDKASYVERVGEQESADLFRPYERRQVRRATVQIFGNSYFHPDLEAFHDDEVQVGYDIHDASRVWVRAMDGRLICIAEFEGNKRAYFPVSAAEAAHERRVEGRKKRLEAKLDEVEAERRAPLTVDTDAADATPEQLAQAEAELDRMIEPPAEQNIIEIDGRPRFGTDEAWAAWLAENPERVTGGDRSLLRERLRNKTFRTLLDFEGVDVEVLDRLAKQSTEAA